MSAVSKLPQARPSRIAGPSKLPSRILRPTFTNKSQPSIPNFVNSAKQIEKKKESTTPVKEEEQSGVDSNKNFKNLKTKNSPLKLPKPSDNKNSSAAVDWNGNRNSERNTETVHCDDETSSVNSFHDTRNNYKSTVTDTKGTREAQSNTVSHFDSNTASPKMNNLDSDQGDSSSPTFRSIKPGYFLQKVNAIKNSHQKGMGEKSHAASLLSKYKFANQENSGFSQTSTSSQNNSTARYGIRAEDRTDSSTKLTNHMSGLKQPSSSASKSKLGQPAGPGQIQSQSPKVNNHSSRAEKRKKYLEIKTVKTIKDESVSVRETGQILVSDQSKAREEGKQTQVTQLTYASIQRPYASRRFTRNAKIAKPVTRPKSVTTTTLPKPYISTPNQTQSRDQENRISVTPLSSRNQMSHGTDEKTMLLKSADRTDSGSTDRTLESDRNSVTSVASEESGYSSVASTVFLDSRINGTKGLSLPSTAFGLKPNWRNGRAHTSETEAYDSPRESHNQGNRQTSQSASEIPTNCATDNEAREAQNGRYCSYIANKDIITYGQYRLETEGNYAVEHRFGVTEGRQIRSSVGSVSSESDATGDRESPCTEGESENTSDSSAETVIPKNKSPVILDSYPNSPKYHEQQGEQEENDEQAGSSVNDEAFIEDSRDLEDSKEENICLSTFQFLSATDKTIFTSARSPDPINIVNISTPSSNSNSKAKKRKTDSVLMSPLCPELKSESKIPGKNEDTDVDNGPISPQQILEKEILFEGNSDKDDEFYSEDDESLSGFIELPSLHDSALMTDYNSILEEDTLSENERSTSETIPADNHEEVQAGDTAPPPTQSVQTNVINKLLSNGLDGITGSREDEATTLSTTKGLVNGYHDDKVPNHKCAIPQKLANHINSSIDEQEIRALKVTLQQLYRIIQEDEEEKTRLQMKNQKLTLTVQKLTNQMESSKTPTIKPSENWEDLQRKICESEKEKMRLELKNQQLAEAVRDLSCELESLKLNTVKPLSQNTQVQTDSNSTDVATLTERDEQTEARTSESCDPPTLDSPRWYHTEVSNEVQSNIIVKEIEHLKDLREDFDKRVQEAEQRLNSALKLMNR